MAFWFGFAGAFPFLAINRDLQRKHGLSIAAIQHALPWVASVPCVLLLPLAALSDLVPVFGRRRGPYLCAFSLCAGLASLLAAVASSLGTYLGALFFLQLAFVTGDLLCMAIITERSRESREETRDQLQFAEMIASSAGRVLGSLAGPLSFKHLSSGGTWLLVALLCLTQFSAACLYSWDEQPQTAPHGARAYFANIRRTLTKDVTAGLLLANAWAELMPSPAAPVFFYMLDGLHISLAKVGLLHSVGRFAHVLVVMVFPSLCMAIRVRALYFYTTQLSALAAALSLFLVGGLYQRVGIPLLLVATCTDASERALREVRGLPLEVAANHLCERGSEASVGAALISVLNVASFLAGQISAGLTRAFDVDHGDFDGLPGLITANAVVNTVLCGLLPIAAGARIFPRINVGGLKRARGAVR